MASVMVITAYWIFGLAGALLLWLDWKRTFPDNNRCPTRRAMVGIILGSLLGPFTLIVGSIVTLIDWLSKKCRKHRSWWDEPIC